jgi:Na+-transporting methylmalonyl-CoA/oxaloacetate decarboxylase gamma subunit
MNLEVLQQYVVYISAGIAGFIVLSFLFYAMKKPSKTVHHEAPESIKIDEPAPRPPAVTIEENEPVNIPDEKPSSAAEKFLKPAPRFTTISKVAPDVKEVKQEAPPETPPPPKTSHWS